MRAEKGYVIVGQETDGTVTLADLGLDWAIGKTKKDFVGKRSLSRPDMLRDDRKQLVGLLTEDPNVVLEEGAQVTESATPGGRLAGARPCDLVLSQRDARPLDRAGARRRRALAHGRNAARPRCRSGAVAGRRSRRRSSTTSRERASMSDALARASLRRSTVVALPAGAAVCARRRAAGGAFRLSRRRGGPRCMLGGLRRRTAARGSGRRARATAAPRSGSARTNGC